MTHPVLHEYDLGPSVTAFSSTRHGGVGQGDYASFNINYYCGDAPSHIEANLMALCQLLQVSPDHIVYPHQTHNDVVSAIDRQWMESLSPAEKRQSLEGVDAVMTNLRGVCVGVSTADCIPILLYDSTHHACCAVHAGWRGTVKRIVQKAVEAMTGNYGTSPQQLRTIIGPGISLEAFEVGDEVYEAFRQAGFDMQPIAMRFPTSSHSTADVKEKWHIDLPECNRQQLTACGIPADNILLSHICTYTDCHTFFSARRLGIHSGRIFTGIMLHP
ncbi:MAG: peptidoglycan editing factor PgeF [Prevotella sp.]|nr:peptidoglycan editing factor PgeF [Prevotella sp.]